MSWEQFCADWNAAADAADQPKPPATGGHPGKRWDKKLRNRPMRGMRLNFTFDPDRDDSAALAGGSTAVPALEAPFKPSRAEVNVETSLL